MKEWLPLPVKTYIYSTIHVNSFFKRLTVNLAAEPRLLQSLVHHTHFYLALMF